MLLTLVIDRESFEAYTDANWAGFPNDKRFNSTYYFFSPVQIWLLGEARNKVPQLDQVLKQNIGQCHTEFYGLKG